MRGQKVKIMNADQHLDAILRANNPQALRAALADAVAALSPPVPVGDSATPTVMVLKTQLEGDIELVRKCDALASRVDALVAPVQDFDVDRAPCAAIMTAAKIETEALCLADILENGWVGIVETGKLAATELRRLHAELEAIKAHATQNSVKNWLALPDELQAMSIGVMLKRDSEQCRRIAELERSHVAKDADIVELKALRQSLAKLVDSLNAQLAVSRAPATDQQIEQAVNPLALFDSYRDTCIWRAAEKHHGIT